MLMLHSNGLLNIIRNLILLLILINMYSCFILPYYANTTSNYINIPLLIQVNEYIQYIYIYIYRF